MGASETEPRLFASSGHGRPQTAPRASARISSLFIASGLFAYLLSPTGTAMAAERIDRLDNTDRILVVGRVTSTPHKDYPRFGRFAGYLAERLGDLGIDDWRIQFAKDNALMIELLRDGIVDLIPETIFSALLYADQADAELLLREWRDGVATYRSVLFARKSSAIRELADLRGKTIAFEDTGSSTAYFVPRAEIEAAGLSLVELTRPGLRPPPDSVGFVLAGSENNIVTWVHGGLVDAGAFSDLDWQDADDMPSVVKQDLEIFHRSQPFPRSVILVRGGLPDRLRDRIKEVLLAADEDPEGKVMLHEYKSVTKFDELDGDAVAGVAVAREILKTYGQLG
jgi:phosphonate transport system substrate-binding protein